MEGGSEALWDESVGVDAPTVQQSSGADMDAIPGRLRG
jgi:hypothetical protein